MGANGEAGSNTVDEEEDLGAMIVWLNELPAEDKLVSSVLEAPWGGKARASSFGRFEHVRLP